MQPNNTPKTQRAKKYPSERLFPSSPPRGCRWPQRHCIVQQQEAERAQTLAQAFSTNTRDLRRSPPKSEQRFLAEKTAAVNFSPPPRFACAQPTELCAGSKVCQGNTTALLLQFSFRLTALLVQRKRLIKGTSLWPFEELMDWFLVVHFPTLSSTRLFW